MHVDSFDITFSPRTFEDVEPSSSRLSPTTPRQRDVVEKLELPMLRTYPVPPNCSSDEPEEARRRKLLEMYQAFAMDMHAGTYLTQLTSSRECSEIHCQLMDDLTTLKMDQSNGHIVEFPLTSVSKVYRIIKSDERRGDLQVAGVAEQVVVVEFMRRKLAFVFHEVRVSQRFLLCLELLIRRAQQQQAKVLRPLTPALPQRPPQRVQQAEACPDVWHQQCPSPTPKTHLP